MRRSSFLLASARQGGGTGGGGSAQKVPLTRLNLASERAAALVAMRSEDAYRARYRPTLGRSYRESDPISSSASVASFSLSTSTPMMSSSTGLVGASSSRPSVGSGAAGPAAAAAPQTQGQRASSSQSASSSSKSATEGEEEESSWAFGGGASSRGGPRESHEHLDEAQRAGHNTPHAPFVVQGSAGKNAVPNYGKRRRDVQYSAEERRQIRQQQHEQQQQQQQNQGKQSKDEEIAGSYSHEYAPTSRSRKPLPHHTYFSSPSSSFNDDAAATATGTGPVGVGGPRSGLGMGAGMLAQSSGAKPPNKAIAKKKTALILPGQGSQYVAMSLDIYRKYRSARHVWNVAEEALLTPASAHQQRQRGSRDLFPPEGEMAESEEQRHKFEEELAKSVSWDRARGLTGAGTAVARSRRGWLRDLVFSGDQLDLTRAENAQPSILVSSLSILSVLRNEFPVDLISNHIDVVAGHGSGTYAALCAMGNLDVRDGVRLLRHRGLASSHYVSINKTLFPEGCQMPESIYETWAFANAGSGKGAELLTTTNIGIETGGVPPTSSTSDAEVAQTETGSQGKIKGGRGWKRSQMSGCMIRPGKLRQALACVERVSGEIRRGEIENVGRDEVVEVANINSSLQIVLSGTRVGVSLASDRLRAEMFGARAVNLPVSGPYHSSLMSDAADFLRPAIEYLPMRDADPVGPGKKLDLVSSCDGSILEGVDAIRSDLSGALAKPVMWLDSIETMLSQGVQRFICLGPGRACAHLLSKELAHRDQVEVAKGGKPGEYEVWSITSVEDVEQLASVFTQLSQSEAGGSLQQQQNDERKAGLDDSYVAL